MFDLVNDPGETRNLARNPEHGDVPLEIRDRLLDLVITRDHPRSPRSGFAFGVH